MKGKLILNDELKRLSNKYCKDIISAVKVIDEEKTFTIFKYRLNDKILFGSGNVKINDDVIYMQNTYEYISRIYDKYSVLNNDYTYRDFINLMLDKCDHDFKKIYFIIDEFSPIDIDKALEINAKYMVMTNSNINDLKILDLAKAKSVKSELEKELSLERIEYKVKEIAPTVELEKKLFYMPVIDSTLTNILKASDIDIKEMVFYSGEDIIIIRDKNDKYHFMKVEGVKKLENSMIGVKETSIQSAKLLDVNNEDSKFLISLFSISRLKNKYSPYCIYNPAKHKLEQVMNIIDNDMTKLMVTIGESRLTNLINDEKVFTSVVEIMIEHGYRILVSDYSKSDEVGCIEYIDLENEIPKINIEIFDESLYNDYNRKEIEKNPSKYYENIINDKNKDDVKKILN